MMFSLAEDKTTDVLEKIVTAHINKEFDNNLEIDRIELFGSRVTASHKPTSDLDVKVFFRGDYREDDVFNGLHNTLSIDGVLVDFFPVKITD